MIKPLRYALIQTWLVLVAACGSAAPEDLLRLARTALEAGEFRTAEIHAKNLLQQAPNDAEARMLLGEISLAAGDAAAAEQNLRIAASLGADAAALQLPLLRSLIVQGKNAEALAQIALGPRMTGQDQVAVLRIAAAAQRGLGAKDEAEATYREAIDIDPRSAAVRTDLATLYAETGRVAAASELLTDVLADEPEYSQAILVRGNIELSTARYAAAEASFRQVLAIEEGAPSRSVYLLALSQVIEMQLAQNNVDGAEADADALLALGERNPQARYLKARVEVARNDLAGAEHRLESLVAEFPDFVPAHRLLGGVNASQSQFGQAEMYLRAALRGAPQDNSTRLLLAEVLIRQGDVTGAREVIETATAPPGFSDSVFLALAGRASVQAGHSELASEFFEQSERAGTQSVQELVDVSRVYVAAGEFERAIRVLETASFDEARNAPLRDYLLALIQLRQGDLAGAAAAAQRLSEQQPDAAWALNLRGVIALLAGDLAGAREWSVRALDLEPNNVAALLTMARISAASNDNEQASEFLERVLLVNPQEPTALLGLARLAAARGDPAEAQEWLVKSPESAARLQMEGDIHAAAGRFDAAAESYARAFDLQPSLDVALRFYAAASREGRPNPDAELLEWNAANPGDPRANFVLGSLALQRGEHDAAVMRYEAALQAEPNHAPTLNNLAWLYGERGDERAIDLGRRAHEAQPDNPAIADTLGWLYLQRGDAATALPLLALAAEALPNQLEVRYHWAVALADTGDSATARRVLEELAGGASFPSQAEARQRLAALEPE